MVSRAIEQLEIAQCTTQIIRCIVTEALPPHCITREPLIVSIFGISNYFAIHLGRLLQSKAPMRQPVSAQQHGQAMLFGCNHICKIQNRVFIQNCVFTNSVNCTKHLSPTRNMIVALWSKVTVLQLHAVSTHHYPPFGHLLRCCTRKPLQQLTNTALLSFLTQQLPPNQSQHYLIQLSTNRHNTIS